MAANCLYLQYFQNIAQIGSSSGVIQPAFTHSGGRTFQQDRPFIPLYGVAESPALSGFFAPVAIASQKANMPGVLRALCVSLFNASHGAADPAFAGTATFSTPGRFDQYLWNKIGDRPLMLSRYKQTFELIIDFWNNLDAAATAQQYQDQLTKLRELALTQVDKELYSAPGAYNFAALDPFVVAFAAWEVADPTLVGLVGLEINSIS